MMKLVGLKNRGSITGIMIVIMLCFSHMAFSQTLTTDHDVRTRILFVLDASGSMHTKWNNQSETRMHSAKKILTEMMDSLSKFKNVEIGLRVYGHQSTLTMRDCKDSRLEVGFSLNSASYIKTKLKTLNPKGITPIAYSLERAGDDFPDRNGRNILILLTDGEESCNGNPCEVALKLERKNVVLKHFVIGLGVSETARGAFDCIGSYYRVEDQINFKNTLELILMRILNKNTSQINLLGQNKKPTETDVNVTLYNSFNHIRKYDFYHTLNAKGLPDTLSIDPVSSYDITVHSIPPAFKQNVTLIPDRHNHIDIMLPQGHLEISLQGKTLNNNLNDKIKCLVKNKSTGNIIHVQNSNTTEKYRTGNYDLEILTLPRTYLKDVDISPNKTTTIKLPTPGIANILKKYEVYGGIFISKNNKLEKIYELNPDGKNETIALHPGNYLLLYRPKYSKSMHNSRTIEFVINSGESISLNL